MLAWIGAEEWLERVYAAEEADMTKLEGTPFVQKLKLYYEPTGTFVYLHGADLGAVYEYMRDTKIFNRKDVIEHYMGTYTKEETSHMFRFAVKRLRRAGYTLEYNRHYNKWQVKEPNYEN